MMLLLLAGLAHSQEAPRQLTLAETLQLVVERNPDHTTAELAETIARIEARRARIDRFEGSVTATAAAQAGVIKLWDSDAYPATDANWEARAALGVPLYAGGAIRANIDAANAGAHLAAVDLAITERTLERAAYTAYWNIKGYQYQIAAAEEGLALTREALQIISAKADAGLAAGIDVNRSKVDLYAQQAALVEQEAAQSQAKIELLRLLHLPGEDVGLTEEPPESGSVDSGMVVPTNAGERRPELERYTALADQADAAVRTARSAMLPSLRLDGSAGAGGSATGFGGVDAATALDTNELRPTLDARMGVSLNWNPFDLLQTQDRVAKARLQAQQVDAAAEGERATIRAEIQSAAAALAALRARAPLVDAQAALARENLQIVQDLYAQGSATILDLFDAQAAFRQARTQGASLRVELALADADLRWLIAEEPSSSGALP